MPHFKECPANDGFGCRCGELAAKRSNPDPMPRKHALNIIRITVQGGVVVDVEDLPDGYKYEVHDYDNAEQGDCGVENCEEHEAPCTEKERCGVCAWCARNTGNL